MNDDEIEPYAHQLTDQLKEFVESIRILRGDLELIIRQPEDPNQDTQQFWRRSLVRASWSLIEALSWQLKQLTLLSCDLAQIPLAPADRELLSERQFFVGENGTATKKELRIGTLPNLKRTLRLAVRVLSLEWKPNLSDKEWSAVEKSLEIRHRVTHPKAPSLLEIQDSEVAILYDSLRWAFTTLIEFQRSFDARYPRSPSVTASSPSSIAVVPRSHSNVLTPREQADLERIRREASLIADGHFELVERLALLAPLVEDVALQESLERKDIWAKRGLNVLRGQLFLDCAKDAWNLAMDATAGSLSIARFYPRLNEALPMIQREYVSKFVELYGGPEDRIVVSPTGTPETGAESNKRLEEKYTTAFQKTLEELHAQYLDMKDDPLTEKFQKLRHEVAAHRTVLITGRERRVRRLGEMGLKWQDLTTFVQRVEKIVLNMQVIASATSYSEDWWTFPKRSAESFWGQKVAMRTDSPSAPSPAALSSG